MYVKTQAKVWCLINLQCRSPLYISHKANSLAANIENFRCDYQGRFAGQQWLLGEVKIWGHNWEIQMADEGHQVLNAVIKLVISKGLSRKELKTKKAVNSITPCKLIQDGLQGLGFWIPRCQFRIPCQWKLETGFQSLAGLRESHCAKFLIPTSRISDSTSKYFSDS